MRITSSWSRSRGWEGRFEERRGGGACLERVAGQVPPGRASRGVEEKERHWREHLAGMTPAWWRGGVGGAGGGLCDSSDHWLLFAYGFMVSEHIWTVKKDCTGPIVQVIVGWPGVSHSVPRGPGLSILVLKD